MARVPARWSLYAASLAVAVGSIQQPREQPGWQYTIVSSTVVTAYCSHRSGDNEALDLLIAWRGEPGWFQRRHGATGGGGTRAFGPGATGRVSQYATYNDVALAFDADFAAGHVAIGDVTVSLKDVNAVLIDQVERAEARRVSTTLWIDPRLPLGVDVNLALARRGVSDEAPLHLKLYLSAVFIHGVATWHLSQDPSG